MTNVNLSTYAKQLAAALTEVKEAQQSAKDITDSARDAGINVRALKKAAKELNMDADKRAQLYEDEAQLSMFRDELGLTAPAFAEAAE